MDNWCYQTWTILLPKVELSFHFFPLHKAEAKSYKIHQEKLGWRWLQWEDFSSSEASIYFLLVLYNQNMIHPDAEQRPSAAALARNRVLRPSLGKTEELQQQLNLEKFKTATLERYIFGWWGSKKNLSTTHNGMTSLLCLLCGFKYKYIHHYNT